MSTYQRRKETAAKAVITITGDFIDPTQGIHALWADSTRVHGLVIETTATIPDGFQLDQTIFPIDHNGRQVNVVVPDPSTKLGAAIAARFQLTRMPVRLLA